MDKKSGLKKTEPGLVCHRIHRMFRTQKQKRAEAVWPQIESPNELEFTEFTLTDGPNSKGKGQRSKDNFRFQRRVEQ